jgi:hypothetical protein
VTSSTPGLKNEIEKERKREEWVQEFLGKAEQQAK